MKHLNNFLPVRILADEKGGAEVVVISLVAFSFCLVVFFQVMDMSVLTAQKERMKLHLNRAVHAASLEINMDQLRAGKLELNPGRARAVFFDYAQTQMRLDDQMMPTSDSYLSDPVEVVVFEVVNEGPFPQWFRKEVVISAGTDKEQRYLIEEYLRGPSLVTAVQTRHRGFGVIGDEILLVPAVEQARFVY